MSVRDDHVIHDTVTLNTQLALTTHVKLTPLASIVMTAQFVPVPLTTIVPEVIVDPLVGEIIVGVTGGIAILNG